MLLGSGALNLPIFLKEGSKLFSATKAKNAGQMIIKQKKMDTGFYFFCDPVPNQSLLSPCLPTLLALASHFSTNVQMCTYLTMGPEIPSYECNANEHVLHTC